LRHTWHCGRSELPLLPRSSCRVFMPYSPRLPPDERPPRPVRSCPVPRLKPPRPPSLAKLADETELSLRRSTHDSKASICTASSATLIACGRTRIELTTESKSSSYLTSIYWTRSSSSRGFPVAAISLLRPCILARYLVIVEFPLRVVVSAIHTLTARAQVREASCSSRIFQASAVVFAVAMRTKISLVTEARMKLNTY
jgi:hypothetical protein